MVPATHDGKFADSCASSIFASLVTGGQVQITNMFAIFYQMAPNPESIGTLVNTLPPARRFLQNPIYSNHTRFQAHLWLTSCRFSSM
jgi:hypothetical protein